jgi:hypothetical protein
MFRPKMVIIKCLKFVSYKETTAQALDDGHFRPKHVVRDVLNNFK